MPGEEAIISKAQYLYGRHESRCDGHKREGGCALPGEISRLAGDSYRGRKAEGQAVRSQQRA